MYEISNELNKFIKLVSSVVAYKSTAEEIIKYDFGADSWTEDCRKDEIKRGIIALVKMYKDIPLDELEEELLIKYEIGIITNENEKYSDGIKISAHETTLISTINEKENLLKLIYELVFRINNSYFKEICEIRNHLYYGKNGSESKKLMYTEYVSNLHEITTLFIRYSISYEDCNNSISEDKFVKMANLNFDDDIIMPRKYPDKPKKLSLIRRIFHI